jgi:hypothetical protein
MFLPQQMPERFAAAFPFDLAGKAGRHAGPGRRIHCVDP